MIDQPNAGVTSETSQTWKTIHTKHTLSHPNKANMEWWWRRPNDIRGPWGPKVAWHLSYRWGKTPEKPHSGNLSRSGIEPGPAAWQARMLPLAPQRWTSNIFNIFKLDANYLTVYRMYLLTKKKKKLGSITCKLRKTALTSLAIEIFNSRTAHQCPKLV